jgi:hypothetical protein
MGNCRTGQKGVRMGPGCCVFSVVKVIVKMLLVSQLFVYCVPPSYY